MSQRLAAKFGSGSRPSERAETSRATAAKGPAPFAVDTTGQEG